MKAVYNTLKEPVINYIKKDVIKEGIKTVGILTQKMNSLEIEDKINIGLEKLDNLQTFTYKPTFLQEKSINNFNSEKYFNQFEFKKIGLNNVISRGFSSKVERMEKFGDPKNDLVFKKLFGEEKNKDLLIDFINKILPGKHVKDIEYLPTNLEPDIRIKKQSILDVLCTDENGSKYIIEMQNAKEKGFEKRAIYYASKTYATQMDKGGKYADLKEVIFIAITDFIMFPGKKDYISTHNIRDTKTNEHDLKDFSFAFLELPKFDKHNGIKGVDEWCDLFKNAKDRKSFNSDNPIMQKAYETLEMSNWSQQDLLDYQAYEKILLDNQAREDQVRDEGINIGENKKAVAIAKQMLLEKEPVEKVIKFTGLTKEEIEKIL